MDKLANSITDYYIKKNVIDADKKEIYSYGFKLIIADIINYAIIITLGIICGRTLESVVFLICLCGLRQFSGGFHAKTFWLCRLSMVITYMCVMLLTDIITYAGIETVIVLSINMLSILFIGIFSPIEHPNKQLSDEQKHNNKIKAIITSVILSVASIILIAVKRVEGVTISITLSSVVILMIIGMAVQRGGKCSA